MDAKSGKGVVVQKSSSNTAMKKKSETLIKDARCGDGGVFRKSSSNTAMEYKSETLIKDLSPGHRNATVRVLICHDPGSNFGWNWYFKMSK